MSIALLPASRSAMAPPVSAKCLRNSRPPGDFSLSDNCGTPERGERGYAIPAGCFRKVRLPPLS